MPASRKHWTLLILAAAMVLSPRLHSATEIVGSEGKARSWWDFRTPDPAANQDEACRDLKPGESRGVNEPYQHNPFRLMRNFRITRSKSDPKQYKVDIPVDFTTQPEMLDRLYGKILTPEQVREGREGDFRARYMAFANRCFEQYKSKIRDPDGNQFHLNFVPKAKDPSNKPQKIKISERQRSQREDWNFKEICSTVVHEALHLIGLVDCYQEHSLQVEYKTGWWPFSKSQKAMRYNCRPPAPPSIMGDHHSILGHSYSVANCVCQAASCRTASFRLIDTEQTPKCPDGYKWIQEAKLAEGNLTAWMETLKPYAGIILVARKLPPPDHTLRRTEAQFIIKPHCTRDNNYVACSQNSYRTKEIDGCLELPESCKGAK